MKKFHFGENLRDIRISKRMKQEEVAIKLDMVQGTYSKLETRVTPPTRVIVKKLAKLFSVPEETLLPLGYREWQKDYLPKRLSKPNGIRFFAIGLALAIFPAIYQITQEICIYFKASDVVTVQSPRILCLLAFGVYYWFFNKLIKQESI
ncbi:MAG: helix-turn-helix domain-containing protein [Bacteroidia bacterium]